MDNKVEIALRADMGLICEKMYVLNGNKDGNFVMGKMPSFLRSSLNQYEQENNVLFFYYLSDLTEKSRKKVESENKICHLIDNGDDTYDVVRYANEKKNVKVKVKVNVL